MPRVSPGEHYKRYVFLRLAWLDFPKLYAVLSLHEQWQLHEFYQPSKQPTRAELTTHIRNLAVVKPALVHQAGKHARLIQRVFRQISEELDIPRSEWNSVLSTPIRRRNPSPARMDALDGKRYTIAVVARPEVNMKLLIRALIELTATKQES
ncbi:hypothetical protein [Streptomyces sp. NPDC002156]